MAHVTPFEWLGIVALFAAMLVGTTMIVLVIRRTPEDRKEFEELRRILKRLLESSNRYPDADVQNQGSVKALVEFIQNTPCFAAKKEATKHLLYLIFTEVIDDHGVVTQIHPTLVRGCMPKAIKKLRRIHGTKRQTTFAEQAIMAWYWNEIPFKEIPGFCPPP